MPTIKSISANPVKNNNGTAVHIGTSSVLGNVSQSVAENVATGSVVTVTDDVDPAVDSAVFANNSSHPLAQRLDNTVLNGSSYPNNIKSINGIESFDTNQTSTAYRAGYWNFYTGKWTTPPVVSYDDMHKAYVEDFIDRILTYGSDYKGSVTYVSGGRQMSQDLDLPGNPVVIH